MNIKDRHNMLSERKSKQKNTYSVIHKTKKDVSVYTYLQKHCEGNENMSPMYYYLSAEC